MKLVCCRSTGMQLSEFERPETQLPNTQPTIITLPLTSCKLAFFVLLSIPCSSTLLHMSACWPSNTIVQCCDVLGSVQLIARDFNEWVGTADTRFETFQVYCYVGVGHCPRKSALVTVCAQVQVPPSMFRVQCDLWHQSQHLFSHGPWDN